jgi:hypothetical protein
MKPKDQSGPVDKGTRKILDRVEQDSHGVFTGALYKLGKITGLSAGHDVSHGDPAEKWGRIVGRTLGFIFLAILIINLFTGWFF